MFYGFLSEGFPGSGIKTEPAVAGNGFYLYINISDRRSFLLDRPKTILGFWGRIYGISDLHALFEPLIKHFEHDGDATRIFSLLEGDFSLILFDRERRVLYLGRDRFARGEIYWSNSSPVWFFTHPALFFNAVGSKPVLNKGPLWDRFANGAITPPETVYQDIFSPVAGEYIELDVEGKSRRVPYWSPLQFVRGGMEQKMDDTGYFIQELRRSFLQKVAEETAPYRKLGVGLSGGMDSAAILGAARKNFTGEIVAVTIGPDGPGSPDLPTARKSARFNNARHIEYYPCAFDLEDLPGLMGRLAQPFRTGSCFMNHQVAKRVLAEGGECVLFGYGADLIFGNAGYCRLFFNKEGGLLPARIIDPFISALQGLPQNRLVTGVTHRLIWYRAPVSERLAERYFRVCKKPRFFQERRLFRKEFLSMGREKDIMERIEGILNHGEDLIVERLIEADFKVVHIYHQVSGVHQVCRLGGLDAIITYYNKDYSELNLMATNKIRGLDGWNKYALREAFKPFVHKDVYEGARGACILKWHRIISGAFREAVIRYLRSSQIICEIFKTEYLHRIDRMIKHPGLMYLNLLGLALWYDVNFNGISPDTPLSTIIDYTWQERDKIN